MQARVHEIKALLIALPVTVLVCATQPARADLALEWFTIDAGGAMWAAGGELRLGGTIGQPDAGSGLTGGNLMLTGGFWSAAANVQRGDLNCDGLINPFDIDPFVLAIVNGADYQAQFPGCNILNGDTNCDGLINPFDIDPFVTCIIYGCPECP